MRPLACNGGLRPAVFSRLLAGLVLAGVAGPAAPADTESLEGLLKCAAEQDDSLRLACYDREAARLLIRDDFGVSGSEVARKRDSEKQASTPASNEKRLTAKVTALSKRPHGELVVTLDNGQIWLQKPAQSYLPLKVGDEVIVAAGALGSYQLLVSGRSTQVTRLE